MTIRPVADPDFWWHLRTGQLISETGTVPRSDPFSFTRLGDTWVTHEWLSELFLFFIYEIGGFKLLVLTFSLIITISYFLVYLRSPGKPYIAGFVVLLAALSSAPTWGVRPQMISFLLTAAFLFFLDIFQAKRNWKILLVLPFLTMLWVNLHGGYILGFALIGINIVGLLIDFFRSSTPNKAQNLHSVIALLISFSTCILASLVNPNTYHILIYPFETITSNSMMLFIQEWFSPDFHLVEWMPLAVLLISLVVAPSLAHRPVSITRLLLIVIFSFAALRSMRFVPLFALTTIPFLSDQTCGLFAKKSQAKELSLFTRWINPFLLIIIIMAVGVRFIQTAQEQLPSEKEMYPHDAARWIIENQPAGYLFNTYSWGGYLIWRLYPEYPVYIDGRADLYGDDFIYDYLSIYNGQPGWENSLEEDGVSVVLIEPGTGLGNALFASRDWTLVFEDQQSILFVRK